MPKKKRGLRESRDYDYRDAGHTNKNGPPHTLDYPSEHGDYYYQYGASDHTPTRARLAAYDNHGYSLPGCTTPTSYPPSYDRHYDNMPRSAQDSDRKTRYAVSNGEQSSGSGTDSSERSRRRKSLKAKIIIAIFILVIFVAVAVSIAVYFSSRQMADDNEAMSSKRSTTTTPASEPALEVSLRVTNREYTSDLADPNSNAYKTAKKEMTGFLNATLGNSNVSGVIRDVEITGFKQGSLIIIYIIHFIITDVPDDQPQPPIWNLIKEIIKNPEIIKTAIIEASETLKKTNQTDIKLDVTFISVVAVSIPVAQPLGTTTTTMADTTTITQTSEPTTSSTSEAMTVPSTEASTTTSERTTTASETPTSTSEGITKTTSASTAMPSTEGTTASTTDESTTTEATTVVTTTETSITSAASTETATSAAATATTSATSATTSATTTATTSATASATTSGTTGTTSETTATPSATTAATTATSAATSGATATTSETTATPSATTAATSATTASTSATSETTSTVSEPSTTENTTIAMTTGNSGNVSTTLSTTEMPENISMTITTTEQSENASTAATTTEKPENVSKTFTTTEMRKNASTAGTTTVPPTVMTSEEADNGSMTTMATIKPGNPSMTTKTTDKIENASTTMTTGKPENASTTFDITRAFTLTSSPNTTASATTTIPLNTTEHIPTVVTSSPLNTTTVLTTTEAADGNVTGMFTSTLTLANVPWDEDMYNTTSKVFQLVAAAVESEVNIGMNTSDAAPVVKNITVVSLIQGSVMAEVEIILKSRSSLTSGNQTAMYDQLVNDDGTEMLYYFKQGQGRFEKNNVSRVHFSDVRFMPYKVGCPKWPTVQKVMKQECAVTYSLMMSAITVKQACQHYANTVRCAAFVLRVQNRTCTVAHLHQRMHKDEMFVSLQRGGIDVRKVCNVSSLKFTTDMEHTPLCDNTDALAYIAQYIVIVAGIGNQITETTASSHGGGHTTPTTIPPNFSSNYTTWFPWKTSNYTTGPFNANYTARFPGNMGNYTTVPSNFTSNYTTWSPWKTSNYSTSNNTTWFPWKTSNHSTSNYTTWSPWKTSNHSNSNYTTWSPWKTSNHSNSNYTTWSPWKTSNHSNSNYTTWSPWKTSNYSNSNNTTTWSPWKTSNYSTSKNTTWFPWKTTNYTTVPSSRSSNYPTWFTGTTPSYTTVPTTSTTPHHPCQTAFNMVDRVLSVLGSLGLRCESRNVSNILWQQDLSAIPQIYEEVRRCNDYVKKLENGPHKCFNLTDPAMQPCYVGIAAFVTPDVVSTSQVCRISEELVRCTSNVNGCSGEESRRKMLEYLSFVLSLKNILQVSSIPSFNFQTIRKAFACDSSGGGARETTAPTYANTTSPHPERTKELRFKAWITLNMTWDHDMHNPNSYRFRQAADYLTKLIDAVFASSDIAPIYASSQTKVLQPGSVRALVFIYLYIDPNPQYHTLYIKLSNGSVNFITEQFNKGVEKLNWPRSTVVQIVFAKPSDEETQECPEWDALWRTVYDACRPSLQAFQAATTVESLCNHFGASLKCASFMAKMRNKHCDLERVKEMAINDTWVFTKKSQVKGYDHRQLCEGRGIQLLVDLKNTPACNSADAYQYIADYICTGNYATTSSTPYPYHTTAYSYESTSSSPGYATKPSYPYKSSSSSPWYWTTSSYPYESTFSSPGYATKPSYPYKSSSSSPWYWTKSSYPYESTSSSPGYATKPSYPYESTSSSPGYATKTTGYPYKSSSSSPWYWTTSSYPYESTSSSPGYATKPSYPYESTSSSPGYATKPSYPYESTSSSPGYATKTTGYPYKSSSSSPWYWTTSSYPYESTSSSPGYASKPSYPYESTSSSPGYATKTTGYPYKSSSSSPWYWTTSSYPYESTSSSPGYASKPSYPYESTSSSPGYATKTTGYPYKSSSSSPWYWTTSSYPYESTSSSPGYATKPSYPYKSSSSSPWYWTKSSYPYESTSSSPGYATKPSYPYESTSSSPGYATKPSYPYESTSSSPGYATKTTGYPYKSFSSSPWYWTTSSYPNGSPSTSPGYAIPCSGIASKAQCIQNTMKYLGHACPMDTVYATLKRYNETILKKDSSQCEEDTKKILSDECYSQAAVKNCTNDMYMLFTQFVPPDVCSWWQGRVLVCVSRNLDKNKCPASAVDRLWRKYILLLVNVHNFTSSLTSLNMPLVHKVLGCPPANQSLSGGKKQCPSVPDLLLKSSNSCFPIYASLLRRNGSMSNCSVPGPTLANTAHMPRTLEQRCQLYGDLLLCLGLSMQHEYDCDPRQLHEKVQEQSAYISALFGFYPHQCQDRVPKKVEEPTNTCKSTHLYELLTKYYCNLTSRASAKEEMSTPDCLTVFAGLSCLTREASKMVRNRICTEEDVVYAMKTSANVTTASFTGGNATERNSTMMNSTAYSSSMGNHTTATHVSCLNRSVLLHWSGQVLVRHGNRLGSVCSMGWGKEDAQVVCTELGFKFAHPFNRSGSAYIKGIGQIPPRYSNFECVGHEPSLTKCDHRSYASCSQNELLASVICSNVELKYELVRDNPGVHYGYINLTRDEGSGLVCTPYTSHNIPASFCRAAGYPHGGMEFPFKLSPPVDDKVWRNLFYCNYDTQGIDGCASNQRWQFGSSLPANDSDGNLMRFPCDGLRGHLVKVFCFNTSVRLNTALFNSTGIPSITVTEATSQRSIPVCRYGFDNATADLFCKEIGFPNGGKPLSFNPYRRYTKYQSYYVNCSGHEQSFTDCNMTMGSCSDVAVVRCHHNPEPGVNDMDVRLEAPVYGSLYRGVRVYYKGEWGTICADSWNDTEASAACKSLGYEGGFASSLSMGRYWPNWVRNVTCGVNSTTLAECSYTEISDSHPCHYLSYAAVRCYNTRDLADYRLLGGASNHSGFVSVTYNNTQGLLCDNLNDVQYDILCRTLGFFGGERYPAGKPPATNAVWSTSFTWDCSKNGINNIEKCRHEKLYKRCNSTKAGNVTASSMAHCFCTFAQAFCYTNRIKLNTGFQNKTGVLQLYHNAGYQDICRKNLTQAALNMLCQHATGMPAVRALLLSPRLFVGLKTQGGVILNSSCLESEQAADTCVESRAFCGRDHLTAVHCYQEAMSDAITGWKLDPTGRVVAIKYNTSGTVCRDNFNDAVANLFCKGLGYFGGFLTSNYMYTNGRAPVWVNRVSCPEGANNFSDCTVVDSTNTSQCFSQAAASVSCYSRKNYTKLYLVDTYSTNGTITGRVMVDKDNRHGYLCRNWKFDDMFASALCKMMDYPKGGFTARNASMIRQPDWSKPAWSAYFHCASGGGKDLNPVKCLTNWSPQSLVTNYSENCYPQHNRTECSYHLVNVTCYTSNDNTTTEKGNSTMSSCPSWGVIKSIMFPFCMTSLDSARYAAYGKCSYYVDVLKCASFFLQRRNYRCPEQDLRRIVQAQAHELYWHTHTSGYGSSSYYGSGSSSHGSTSGGYTWGGYTSSGYHGSRGYTWGGFTLSGYHGSRGYTWDGSASSGYHGSGESSWQGSISPSYSGSGGSISEGSGSSHYPGSTWDGFGSSTYPGSGASHWGSPDSSGYPGSRGSSWDGFGSSIHPSSGGSPWDRSGSSGYHGSGSSWDGSGSHGSSGYSSHGYTSSSSPGSSSGGSGSPATSLPYMCENYTEPTLVDMEKTEPCANPEIIRYIAKYHCQNMPYTTTPSYYHQSTSYNGHNTLHYNPTPSYYHQSTSYNGHNTLHYNHGPSSFSSRLFSDLRGSQVYFSGSQTGSFSGSSVSDLSFANWASAFTSVQSPSASSAFAWSSSSFAGSGFESIPGPSEWSKPAWSSLPSSATAFTNSGSRFHSPLTATTTWSGDWSSYNPSGTYSSHNGYSSGYSSNPGSDDWSSFNPSATHSSHYGSSTEPFSSTWSSTKYYTPTPYYTTSQPSRPPDNACRPLSQKLQCVRETLASVGITCQASTLYETVRNYSHVVLSPEANMCSNFTKGFDKDACFQAIANDKSSCLVYFENITTYQPPCTRFDFATQCSMQKYPTVCRHENTARILQQWLSVEHMIKIVRPSLNISEYVRQNLLRCYYYQVKDGCPSFNQLAGMLLMHFSSNTGRISNATSNETLCRSYKDVLAFAILRTAEYRNCSADQLHQIFSSNYGAVETLTNISIPQCAGNIIYPQINKTEDLCLNSYFIKFLTAPNGPCGYTNLLTPVNASDTYRRTFTALRCYTYNASMFLPPLWKCNLQSIIKGLKANSQYVHSSYGKHLVPVLFFVDNQTLSSSRPQGRVAVTFNGTSGYFCHYPSTSETFYSTVCRLMGYPRGGEQLNRTSSSWPQPNTYSKSWKSYLTCGHWDRKVHPISCMSGLNLVNTNSSGPYGDACGIQNVLAVSCIPDYEDYRLVAGPNKTRGMLAIWNNANKDWEQVCRTGFNATAANAACRQLGFFSGGQLTPQGNKPQRYYSMSKLRFQCSGSVGEKLSHCPTSTSYSCQESTPVWLKCGTA
ncbi:hypothetical protein ACOMHN_007100 [Nucella lapillus]